MSGPGARVQKVGTIFTRVQGLLRSGALKESEKPLWYDVYRAFPPKAPHKHFNIENAVVSRKILYLDDLVRAQFYKTFGNIEPVDMRDGDKPHISQKFIDKYWVLQKQNPSKKLVEIFEATTDALKMEGVQLKSLAEIKQEQEAERLKQQGGTQSSSPAAAVTTPASVASLAQQPHQLAEAEDTFDLLQHNHKT